MSESESKKDNLKYAMCYIPFVAIIIYIVEANKTRELQKHINYWLILLGSIVIINIILKTLYLDFFAGIAALLYIIGSGYLWYKIFSWEEVEVGIIDKIEQKIKTFTNKGKEDEKDVFNDDKD